MRVLQFLLGNVEGSGDLAWNITMNYEAFERNSYLLMSKMLKCIILCNGYALYVKGFFENLTFFSTALF